MKYEYKELESHNPSLRVFAINKDDFGAFVTMMDGRHHPTRHFAVVEKVELIGPEIGGDRWIVHVFYKGGDLC